MIHMDFSLLTSRSNMAGDGETGILNGKNENELERRTTAFRKKRRGLITLFQVALYKRDMRKSQFLLSAAQQRHCDRVSCGP